MAENIEAKRRIVADILKPSDRPTMQDLDKRMREVRMTFEDLLSLLKDPEVKTREDLMREYRIAAK